MKKCSKGPGHMTNMAATPRYIKTFKNLLLQKHFTNGLELDMWHCIHEYYKDCSNDDLGLALTFLYDKAKYEKILKHKSS